MLLFPAADWGADTLAQNRVNATEPSTLAGWTAFVNRLPYSAAAKAAIVRIQTDATTDWLQAKHGPMSVDDKLRLLTKITYKQYLTNYLAAPEEAIVQYQRTSHGLLGAGVQATSASDMWLLGQPGFAGLGLPDPDGLTFPGIGRTPQMGNMVGAEPSVLWPDGNTSLLRLLVSKLIPAAFPDVDGGRPNQENIVKARCDYTQLDRPGNVVRIRLNSLVINVEPGDKRGGPASVDYMPVGGDPRHADRLPRLRHARDHGVLEPRDRASRAGPPARAGQEPLLRPQGPADLRPRRAQQLAGVGRREDLERLPARQEPVLGQHDDQRRRAFGSAYGPTPNGPPTAPASLSFTVVPNDPLRTPQIAAYESGREQLLNMSFADLEGALIDVIDRSVNKAGGSSSPPATSTRS